MRAYMSGNSNDSIPYITIGLATIAGLTITDFTRDAGFSTVIALIFGVLASFLFVAVSGWLRRKVSR